MRRDRLRRGHGKKSGEWVSLERFREKYGEMDFFAFWEQKLNELVPDVRSATARSFSIHGLSMQRRKAGLENSAPLCYDIVNIL